MPKNLWVEDLVIVPKSGEKKSKLLPLVHWRSSGPDPYIWPYLVVELALFADPCGCRRKRLREHSEKYHSRWAMYYQTVLDPMSVDIVDPRCVTVPSQFTMFVAKLYAEQTTLSGHPDKMENRMEAQRKLTLEFVWIIRPCERHGEKLDDLRRRGCGAHPPAHMKRIK